MGNLTVEGVSNSYSQLFTCPYNPSFNSIQKLDGLNAIAG